VARDFCAARDRGSYLCADGSFNHRAREPGTSQVPGTVTDSLTEYGWIDDTI
jgi:hypothetical protein